MTKRQNNRGDLFFTVLCGAVIFLALYFGSVYGAHGASTKTIGDISHSLKSGATSFTAKFDSPHKLTLFPEASAVKTSYSIVCLKGNKVSTNARSFTTSFTRNLLYGIPARQDVCYLVLAAATTKHNGQIVVEATIR